MCLRPVAVHFFALRLCAGPPSNQGVIHYYPYDGEKETRPQARLGEEDDESITIEAFWEGRLVPESHAAALSFFPMHKL